MSRSSAHLHGIFHTFETGLVPLLCDLVPFHVRESIPVRVQSSPEGATFGFEEFSEFLEAGTVEVPAFMDLVEVGLRGLEEGVVDLELVPDEKGGSVGCVCDGGSVVLTCIIPCREWLSRGSAENSEIISSHRAGGARRTK